MLRFACFLFTAVSLLCCLAFGLGCMVIVVALMEGIAVPWGNVVPVMILLACAGFVADSFANLTVDALVDYDLKQERAAEIRAKYVLDK